MIHDEKISLRDWLCLDYVDKLKTLLDNPWGVQGLHYSTSLLASYLISYRPAQMCENPVPTHGDTSRDIVEVYEHVFNFSVNFVTRFMLMLGYELDANTSMACWSMKHVDDL